MSALNRFQIGRVGFEYRNLSRRAHRFEFHSEPLEARKLLSTGPIATVAGASSQQALEGGTLAAPAAASGVAISAATSAPLTTSTASQGPNPTVGIQASLPTDNSSSTNVPGVSPTVPPPLNVATDDSASVSTSPFSDITALIPFQSSFTSFAGVPVFIVPMADSDTGELSIESPELAANSSPVTPSLSSMPVIPHPINVPTTFQVNNSATAAMANLQPVQQPAVLAPTQHIGQSLETELQKPATPELGPKSGDPAMLEVDEPFTPLKADAPGKIEEPKGEQQPGGGQQKANPADAAPTPEKAPPVREVPPLWWVPLLPVPIPVSSAAPMNLGPEPAASGAFSQQGRQIRSSDQPALSAFLGVAAATGGARLAMTESRRFGMHWLPNRVASSRSVRPRVAGR